MSSQLLQQEDNLIQIRDKLRKDGIKLWLNPYYNETAGQSIADVKQLAQDYSTALNLQFNTCYDIINELQTSSLENLKQKNLYQKSGLATLKIKVLHQNSPPAILTKELMLSLTAAGLKDIILRELELSGDRLKLICAGKILNDNELLSIQGVKNGQQILAIVLTESSKELVESENQAKELEGIKTDSKLLALDNQYMQLEDQFGNRINIPAKEKQALIVAMALHEKGKAALKKQDYAKALIFLLESDPEYKRCGSQLLKTVDNYALLDLDIAWCYLCLQSFVHLPEAFERLNRCETKFKSIYGDNLERLIAVKGSSGIEAALYMRLHLLQAIVLYHQNKRQAALNLLKTAKQELQNLKVDDGSVLALVELGYSSGEARLGLRVAQGDVNRAANYINETREKRVQGRKKAIADDILQRERQKLGKCLDGQYVDPKFVKILVNMGYNKEVARIALQKSNNVISDSIQYIQENPAPGPSDTKSKELLNLIEDLIPELEAAGFDKRMAQLALHKHFGDVMKAAEELLANNGVVLGDLSSFIGVDSVEKIKKKQEAKEEAFKRLSEDISIEDDDHLDLTLDQEEIFLNQYMALLDNNN